jgi:hypothetical protein
VSATDVLLTVALEAAVALRIAELCRLDDATFARSFDRAVLDRLAQTVAEHGDDLLFRSTGRRRGESARVFNAVADGIALLAFAPGGATLFGRSWVATR